MAVLFPTVFAVFVWIKMDRFCEFGALLWFGGKNSDLFEGLMMVFLYPSFLFFTFVLCLFICGCIGVVVGSFCYLDQMWRQKQRVCEGVEK